MRVKRVLVVQSRQVPDQVEWERKNFRTTIGEHALTDFLSALDERLAWTYPDEFLKDYDGVIFSGSSDFDLHGGRDAEDPARIMATIILSRVKLIVQYALAEAKPVLGVCFGHQLIAEMHGGHVQKDPFQSKHGSHEIHVNEEGRRDPIFGSIAVSFPAHYRHNDSVTNLPEGATLLAEGPACRFSVLRYGKKAYTVQFHPEIQCACLKGSQEASHVVHLWIERIVA